MKVLRWCLSCKQQHINILMEELDSPSWNFKYCIALCDKKNDNNLEHVPFYVLKCLFCKGNFNTHFIRWRTFMVLAQEGASEIIGWCKDEFHHHSLLPNKIQLFLFVIQTQKLITKVYSLFIIEDKRKPILPTFQNNINSNKARFFFFCFFFSFPPLKSVYESW